MKKKIPVMFGLFAFLLLMQIADAQPMDWFSAATVTTQLNISSSIDIIPTGINPLVQSLQADVIFVPQNNENTAVRSFVTAPNAIATADRVKYSWMNPKESVNFSYSAIVERANNEPLVTAKIPYPAVFPPELDKYKQPAENIDSTDPAIIGQAEYLARGEDDLFMVVSKNAIWVKNNIQYNLSTLTADVSQPASWVLKNREGVCDEITSLFIAMLRSRGIPARFVSGIAFTNSEQFPQGWGAHGWAEVYFPGTGWVSFDPTFGEFGWVDAGHIKLKESLGPKEPTTVFEWKARDADVKVHDLLITAEKLFSSGRVPSPLKIKVKPMRERVGFGSFNGVTAEVQNLADYYVAPELVLTRVNDITIISEEHQQAIIPPKSSRTFVWKVKTAGNLDPKYQYEIPLHVYTIKNETADSSFYTGKWDIIFSEADIDTNLKNETEETYFDLACQPAIDKTRDESAEIICQVQNKKITAQQIRVCMFSECRNIVAGPEKMEPVSFTFELPKPGKYEVVVTAETDEKSKKAVLGVVKLDEAGITIKDVKIPEQVDYGQDFQIDFVLGRESIATPVNVTVKVKGPGVESIVPIGDLAIDQDVTINVKSSQLYSGQPIFTINAEYYDVKEHHAEQQVSLTVLNVPWWKRVLGFFIQLF